jgi:hypothetical protein
MLSELGSEPARCVAIYLAWTNGTINREHHPRDLSENRHPAYEFAHRIQRKLRRIRLKVMIKQTRNKTVKDQLLTEYRTLVGPAPSEAEMNKLLKARAKSSKDVNSVQAESVSKNWFIHQVIAELVRRGWTTEQKHTTCDNSDKDTQHKPTVFSAASHGIIANVSYRPKYPLNPGYYGLTMICGIDDRDNHITLSTNDGTYVSSFPESCCKPEAVKLQLATDLAEVGFINEQVREHQHQLQANSSLEFERLARILNKRAKVNGLELSPCVDSNTVRLSVTHNGLTVQAAQLLINAYESIELKIRAILNGNDKRLVAKHRFPPTPDQIVNRRGAVPKQAKIAVVTVNREKEEDVDES